VLRKHGDVTFLLQHGQLQSSTDHIKITYESHERQLRCSQRRFSGLILKVLKDVYGVFLPVLAARLGTLYWPFSFQKSQVICDVSQVALYQWGSATTDCEIQTILVGPLCLQHHPNQGDYSKISFAKHPYLFWCNRIWWQSCNMFQRKNDVNMETPFCTSEPRVVIQRSVDKIAFE